MTVLWYSIIKIKYSNDLSYNCYWYRGILYDSFQPINSTFAQLVIWTTNTHILTGSCKLTPYELTYGRLILSMVHKFSYTCRLFWNQTCSSLQKYDAFLTIPIHYQNLLSNEKLGNSYRPYSPISVTRLLLRRLILNWCNLFAYAEVSSVLYVTSASNLRSTAWHAVFHTHYRTKKKKRFTGSFI